MRVLNRKERFTARLTPAELGDFERLAKRLRTTKTGAAVIAVNFALNNIGLLETILGGVLNGEEERAN